MTTLVELALHHSFNVPQSAALRLSQMGSFEGKGTGAFEKVKCQRAEQESMLIHPSALRTEPITEELSRRCGIL